MVLRLQSGCFSPSLSFTLSCPYVVAPVLHAGQNVMGRGGSQLVGFQNDLTTYMLAIGPWSIIKMVPHLQ